MSSSSSSSSTPESMHTEAASGASVPKLTQTAPSPYMGSHLAVGNIIGSPASTYAGVGLIAATVAQALSTQAMPSTTSGWIAFSLQLALGILAALSHR